VDRNWAAIVVLVIAVVALAAHDLSEKRRILTVTLLGALLLIGSRMVALFVVSHSGPGLAFIRALL
jgi:hypothetical protein